MLSFIHTADVHLDAPLQSLSGVYELRQDDFRSTMRRIRDLVWDKQADFWLIAGDLLEYHGGRRSTAIFLRDLFASLAPVPVCIAPGNHDPWRSDSFYQTLDWSSNVYWFTPEWGAFEFPEKSCVVYGWGFPHPHVYESPLDTFPGKLNGYQHHLMVLHASILTSAKDDHHPYAPVSLQELAKTGMDYVALGHIHKPAQFPHPEKRQPFAAYPGSPEGLTAKEAGPRCVLFGELSDSGTLTLSPIAVEQRQICKREIVLGGIETMEQCIERLEGELAEEKESDLLYITLTGERSAHFVPAIEVLKQKFSRFFLIQFTDQTWPDVDADKLIADGGVWGRWLAKLAEWEEQAADEEMREKIREARKEALARIGGSVR
ncbi:metallophosphoesterase family protein [Brevibacillus reuszeri]|uniref:DNA repair exonuclease n=1 Tax=Brevibacillus reuszeri TaxID=54915 RepID=A0A0K9YN07_9BACL|nr:DNA repair exonuclease [Brevibacillus reuszeri]KNB70133.1 DNA repair exonuclease [Brevibacillus reuszeri]MED1856026.1 metallophosphoesterase [Brevibacillus reuszeri]